MLSAMKTFRTFTETNTTVYRRYINIYTYRL